MNANRVVGLGYSGWMFVAILAGALSALPSPAQTPVSPPADMTGWWSFDGHYRDLAGAHTGTAAGSPAFVSDGKALSAVRLNGSTQWYRVDGTGLVTGHSEATIEGWIRTSGSQSADYAGIFHEATSSGASIYSRLGVYARLGGELEVGWRDSDGAGYSGLTSAGTVPSGTWTHFAATYKAGEGVKLFLNGALDTQASLPALGALPGSASDCVVIGGTHPTSGGAAFTGDIDELTVYTRALTTNEIAAIYAADSAGKLKPNPRPVPPTQSDRTLAELTTLVVTNAAEDAETPFNVLAYALLEAPDGASIGPATGIIEWTPGESQGPSSNRFVTVVTDNGIPPLSATNAFNVFVLDRHAVTFDLGSHGTRTGGGALSQTVTHGSAATAPTVQANYGWVFDGWDTTFDAVTGPLTVTALYTPYVVVANVAASQRPGTKLVDIYYDLFYEGSASLDIGVTVSNAAGVVAATSLSGAVGTGVQPGVIRHIVWDAGADHDEALLTGLHVEVHGTPAPAPYIVVDLSAGVNATNYPVSYLDAVPPGGWAYEHKTTKLVLRRVPATAPGFTMGSPSGELGHEDDETLHPVTLTEDFYIGVFELTQRQWELVMGYRPSYFNNVAYYPTRPVEQVSYYHIRENPANRNDPAVHWPANRAVNADSFMGRLRARTGLSGFDLPTESQWEYACRAGTTTALNSGYDLTGTTGDLRMSEVGRYYYNGGSAGHENPGCAPTAGTAPVGSYQPNAWGLYDMHGNIWEWCLDGYGAYPATAIDPQGASSGWQRVLRGGSFYELDYASYIRSAGRNSYWPDGAGFGSGFRACCGPSLPPGPPSLHSRTTTDVDTRDYSLSVSSVRGTPVPAVGMHSDYCWHSTVTCTVDASVTAGGTNTTCTGWSGTGSVPANGATNDTGAILLTNVLSAIAWNWQDAAYYLDTGDDGNGTVDLVDDWYTAGTEVTLTAQPDPHHHLAGWSGHTNGCTAAGDRLTVPVTQARALVALFMKTGFDLWADEHGLSGDRATLFTADRNADGVPNAFEYAFGTNLPPGATLLDIRVRGGVPIADVPQQDASSLPFVDVRVTACTNLPCLPGGWTLPMVPASDTTGKPANRAWFQPEGDLPDKAFFRLEAELAP